MPGKNPEQDRVHIFTCGICIDTTNAGEAGMGAGAKLGAAIREHMAPEPYKGRLAAKDVRCMVAYIEGSTLSIGQSGKFKYQLGRPTDNPLLIEQVLEFAVMCSESEVGVVPSHEWPPLLGTHILARIPPCTPRDPDQLD